MRTRGLMIGKRRSRLEELTGFSPFVFLFYYRPSYTKAVVAEVLHPDP